MKKEQVTEEMKRLMSEADRQQLFGISQSVTALGHPPSHDSPKKDYVGKLEKQEHEYLINWLNQREWFYVHSRMDKPTSNQKGIPDFVIGLLGWMICIEFKLAGRKLTQAQEEWRRRAVNSRVHYWIYDNAGEAIRMLQEFERLASGDT